GSVCATSGGPGKGPTTRRHARPGPAVTYPPPGAVRPAPAPGRAGGGGRSPPPPAAGAGRGGRPHPRLSSASRDGPGRDPPVVPFACSLSVENGFAGSRCCRRGPAHGQPHVPGEAQQGEGADAAVTHVDLPPVQPVAGRGREGVVVVMPTFAEGQ